MPKVFTSKSQKIGQQGENIACIYLKNKNFKVIGRNYTQKWGEIDIIAMKAGKLHFIEVKAVTYTVEASKQRSPDDGSVTRVTNSIRPEDNMHPRKIQRIHRTIETYLGHKGVTCETDWQLDLICVYLDDLQKKAQIRYFDNIF